MAGMTFFGKRQSPGSRAARDSALRAVNVDKSDMDEDMQSALGGLAAQRQPWIQANRGAGKSQVPNVPGPGDVMKAAGKWLSGLGKPKAKR